MKPCDVERTADVCALQVSHEISGRHHIMVQHDGAVILSDHVSGKAQTGSVTIPRRTFLKFVEWYQTDQP